VFQVQDQFTREIVSALEPALRGRTAATAADVSRGTTDPAAYDLYLKGRYFWAKRGAANIRRSIGYFTQAVARDPRFARAHAGLAMADVVLPEYVSMNTDSVLDLAVSSGRRALALDPTLGDAHVALCGAEHQLAHFADAERECRAALAIEPNDPTARQWHAENLAWLGQLPEALTEIKRAAALDPLSAIIASEVSQDLYMARDFPHAAAEYRHAIAIDSSLTVSHLAAALGDLFSGHADSAVAQAETTFRDDSTLPGTLGALVMAYAAAGRWSDATRVRARIARDHERKRARKGDAISYDDLAAALTFGAPAAERASLIRRIDWTDMVAIALGSCDPLFDPLKRDPAFTVAARHLGIHVCPAMTPWPIKPRI
jgi:serine/threonine-protein kinase